MEGGSCHQQPSCGGHRKLLCAGLMVTGKAGMSPLYPIPGGSRAGALAFG